ncbi:hypothetical protein V1522DRAFT_357659, partial [Lipomyces starkeyi]
QALFLLKNNPPEPRLDIPLPDSQYVKLEESWSKFKSENRVYNGGSGTETGDIQAQGHALNALGIPWTYWDIMQGSESCSGCTNPEVSIDSGSGAFGVLSSMMKEASSTTTVFDWSPYFVVNSNAKAITDGTCGTAGSACTCSVSSPCQGDLE